MDLIDRIKKLVENGPEKQKKDKNMLGAISLKGKRKDFRFMDPEVSKSKRFKRKTKIAPADNTADEAIVPGWMPERTSAFAKDAYSANENGVNIIALANERFQNQQRALKAKPAHVSIEPNHLDVSFIHVEEEPAIVKPAEKESWAAFDKQNFNASIGIFSDSKSYSALIRNELLQHHLNVKHFNHPRTFVPSKYDFFDKISAWMLFISDEDMNDAFIESFIDRYSDKPTLFLCPKMSRTQASEKINAFISSNALSKHLNV